jgi:hypothetical protein
VQIGWSSRRGSRQIEHLGSAHEGAELAALKAVAAERIAAGQQALDLGLDAASAGAGPLEIVGTRAGHLWDALCRAYDSLGFDHAAGVDGAFRALVLARITDQQAGLAAGARQAETVRPSGLRPARRRHVSAARQPA